jgi:hypothetical protein
VKSDAKGVFSDLHDLLLTPLLYKQPFSKLVPIAILNTDVCTRFHGGITQNTTK